jgi:hypothetical protein
MNVSDVNAVSGMQEALTRQQIGTAVLVKAKQAAEQQGEAALALIESAVQLTHDADSPSGHQLDVTA